MDEKKRNSVLIALIIVFGIGTILAIIFGIILLNKPTTPEAQETPVRTDWYYTFVGFRLVDMDPESFEAEYPNPPFEKINENWWENPPRDTEEYHYEIGYGEGSNEEEAVEMAKLYANAFLAQYINCSITTMKGPNYTSFESQSMATLVGVQYLPKIMDNGSCYVLAALPVAPYAEQMQKQMQEAFPANEASEEAKKKMQEDIDNYFH